MSDCKCEQQDHQLSCRLRPGGECAPWVVEAVKKLEAQIDGLGAELALAKAFHDAAAKERDLARTQLAHAQADAEQAVHSLQYELGQEKVAALDREAVLKSERDSALAGVHAACGSKHGVNEACVLESARLVRERTAERDEAQRLLARAQAQIETAQAVFHHGADDENWIPGETVIDALIRGRADALQRAEAAELGSNIAYKREPTQKEGDAHEYEQHQSMGPILKTGECFVSMGGWTGRRCRVCSKWVWGGPTACEVCVAKEERDESLARVEGLGTGMTVLSVLLGHPPEGLIEAVRGLLQQQENYEHDRAAWDVTAERMETMMKSLVSQRASATAEIARGLDEAREQLQAQRENMNRQFLAQLERASQAGKERDEALARIEKLEAALRLLWEEANDPERFGTYALSLSRPCHNAVQESLGKVQ